MTNKKRIALLIMIFVSLILLSGCRAVDETRAIGQGFQFEDIFIYPIAGVMWVVAKTIGFGNYGLTIIFTTIIVRTLAWPIYAKTNDLSLKMKLAQPEQARIQKKYEGRDDEISKQKMQIEIMQLYKKYGIGLGGCLTPILQIPIFIGVFRTISRMPATILGEGGVLLKSGHWLRVFDKVEIFNVNLLLRQTADPVQKWGVIIFAILVGLTQVFSIILTQIRQKKASADQFSDVPAYRRPQADSMQRQTQLSMNIMMFMMTAMMVLFVLRSPAGLGLYWLVGNIYSTGQSTITHLTSKKRLEKLKSKY